MSANSDADADAGCERARGRRRPAEQGRPPGGRDGVVGNRTGAVRWPVGRPHGRGRHLRRPQTKPLAAPADPGSRGQTLAGTEQLIQAMLRPVITRVVDAALAELDLTAIILDNVDLDAVAAKLDVEAVIKRVDLDGVVATVDLDAAVARVDLDQIVSRIDIDSIVAGVNIDAVIDRVDVDSIVKRVDLDAAVAQVDLDAAVARVDMEQIISRIDVDSIVATVDLEAVVDRLDIAAVVAKVDPDPIVARVNFDAAMAQIDLIGIAQKIVDGIDLPGIIRDSTGSLASEAVHGVRVQGQQADDAVGQLVGRVFRRRAALDGLHPS